MPDAKKELKIVMLKVYVAFIFVIIGIAIMINGIRGGMDGSSFAQFSGGLMISFVSLLYGVPICWLMSSEKRKKLRAAVIILETERMQIPLLASTLGCSDADAKERAVWCIERGYLPGYVVNGEEVLLYKLVDPNLEEHAVECPNCDASFTYVGKIGQCPYCGDYYPPRNKN